MRRKRNSGKLPRPLTVFLVLTLAVGTVQPPALATTPAPAAPQDVRGDWRPESERGWVDDVKDWFAGKESTPQPRELGIAAVPRRDPAPEGKALPPARRVKELTAERSAYGKVFLLADGRRQAEVSAEPLHYRDGDGTWQPVKTAIAASERAGFPYANRINGFVSSFGDEPGAVLRLEADGAAMTLGADGVRAGRPRVSGDTATYAYGDGAKLEYQVRPSGVEQRLVLTSAPRSASYGFTVRAEGLRAWQRPDGSIALYRGEFDGRPVMEIPKPSLTDARDDDASPYGKAFSDKATQSMRWDAAAGLLRVTVTVDQAWTADPARRYPVTLSRLVKASSGEAQDTTIVSDAPDTTYDTSRYLSTGPSASGVARSLLRFPLAGVPAGTRIDAAQLRVHYDRPIPGGDVTLEAHRASGAWDEATATWRTASGLTGELGGNTEVVDDGDAGKTAATGAWAAAADGSAAKAGGGDYLLHQDATAGDGYTWVPSLTEDGDYRVDVHYVEAADRADNTPYTVTFAGGSKTYEVSQQGDEAKGVWKTLGTHRFTAGTGGRIVLGDRAASADTAVAADSVRLTRPATQVRRAADNGGSWHAFPVRDIVQSWLDGAGPNHGFVLKAADETLGKGGVRYAGGPAATRPLLVVTYGRQGVAVAEPTTIHATGAELSWPAYRDPSPEKADDIVEYQVHRSTGATFTPSAATLVAPLPKTATSFTDSTAQPTPITSADPFARVYHYMVAVKTKDGQLVAGPTVSAALPKAGRTVKVFQGGDPDTTLTSGRNTPDGASWLSVGTGAEGETRALLAFPGVSSIPTAARVLDARLDLWPVSGTGTGPYELRPLTRDFDEKTATWTDAAAGTKWTAAGGDAAAGVPGGAFAGTQRLSSLNATPIVRSWVADRKANHGLLVTWTGTAGRSTFQSGEAEDPHKRPKLLVTYTEKTAEDTYYAPDTPGRMDEGRQASTEVTLTNTTDETWQTARHALSYRWTLPDGTDVTNAENQLRTTLPKDVPPGESVTVAAQVKAPVTGEDGNQRTEYVLRTELYDYQAQAWLSAGAGVEALAQAVAVDKPTSDELGTEAFYKYAGVDTGAGGAAQTNLHAGNGVWTYAPWSHPSRGDFSTFVNLTYNAGDTSGSSMGFGWSLRASSVTRLGSPLDFQPDLNPTTVVLTDGDGTSHTFSWDAATSQWISPKGVHLYLQRLVTCDRQTVAEQAWVMTRPDRTQFYFDCAGYLTSTQDRNGMVNRATFTYTSRTSGGRPVRFLRYITDPARRETLTVEYYARGENYTWINDDGEEVDWANLVNPLIIDRVKSITDIEGRKLTFLYTSWGLMAKMIDGDGSDNAKTFRFAYDMSQGNRNAKLVRVTDPRGRNTAIAYNFPFGNPRYHWWVRSITDRLSGRMNFAYSDPDGSSGSAMNTVVTDAENHNTAFRLDGYGRTTQITDARNQVTKLGWDNDHNVVRVEENNGAVTTAAYDPLTGYPLATTDAEATKNGTPSTVFTYQSGFNGHIADLIAKSSPEGRRYTFTYDAWGNVTSVTDPAGNASEAPDDFTTKYVYDIYGQATQSTDPNGNTTTYGDYDPTGQPQTINDPYGNANRVTYDWRGLPLAVSNAAGASSHRSYDLFGRILTTTIRKDQAVSIVTPAPIYDANDNITRSTAPNGAVSTATYDANDQLTSTLKPKDDQAGGQERKTTFTYDRVGNRLTGTEPNGNLTPAAGDFTTTSAYDEIYRLTSVTDAKGFRSRYFYDNAGNLATLIDARKNATPDQLDYTAKFGYDQNHQLTSVTDAGGYVTKAGYDRDGLRTTTTDQNNRVSTTVYDPRGKVVETRVPHEVVDGTVKETIRRFEYDQAGNRTKEITPRGVETTDDPSDFLTETRYDKLNRPVEQVYPFDKDDNQHAPDYPYRKAHSVLYSYDAASRLTSVALPEPDPDHLPEGAPTGRITSTTEYYDNGWIKKSTDPFGVSVSYDYNPLGQQTKRTVAAAGGGVLRELAWDYFPDGKLKHHDDGGGASAPPFPQTTAFDYRYDANGNLKQIKHSGSDAPIDQWDLDYTALNQAEKVTESLLGTVKNTTTYAYNENGGLTRRAHDKTIADYTYDARDLLESVRNASSATDSSPRLTRYSYTPRGERAGETKSNGNVATYEYFLDGLLRHSVEKKRDGAVQAEHTLQYQANLQVSRDEAKLQCVEFRCLYPQVTKNYTYDPRDRVNKVEYDRPGWGEEYEYDANSNVLRQVVVDKISFMFYDRNRLAQTFAPAGQDPTEYIYDPSGRLQKVNAGEEKKTAAEYTYDAFDQITRTQLVGVDGVTRNTSYTYDPLGRTSSTTDNDGKKTIFSYLGMSGEVLDEEVNGAVTRSFEYSAWDERLSMARQGADGSTERSVYGYDAAGNVEIITNDAGDNRSTYGYSIYGSLVPGSVSGVDTPDETNPYKEPYNPYWFNARRYDQLSDTYQMGSRNYRATSHQFLTPATRMDSGADLGLNLHPSTTNRYGYAAGLSINNLRYSPPTDWKRELASFGSGLLVGIGVGALAALCPETGVTCGLAVAAAAGAAGAATSYGVNVALDPNRTFHAGEFTLETLSGAGLGALGFGVGRVFSAAADPAERGLLGRFADRVRGCAPNSFVPGTKVQLADGTVKDIEKVKPGDKVLATDPETGKTEAKPVSALIKGKGEKKLVRITIAAAGKDGKAAEVTATDAHPFWVRDAGRWVPAKDLRPGMWLRTSSGTYVQIKAVAKRTAQDQTVHNLTVADLHTYYVLAGVTPVLVHNACPNGEAQRDLAQMRQDMGMLTPAQEDALAAANPKLKGIKNTIGRMDFDGTRPSIYGQNGRLPRPVAFPGKGNGIAAKSYLDDAEGDMVSQALKRGYSGGNATIFTDRITCPWCANSMAGYARALNLETLTVYGPNGLVGIWNQAGKIG